jgi:uncharacterized protein (TIGR00251 family)
MSRGQVKNVTGDSFFVWEGDVLVVNILGKPSAARDVIGKPKGTQLKVSVTAAPVAGKATDHMVRFLAPLFGVAVADIEVVFGRENVNKQLRIKAPTRLPAVFTQGTLQF